MTSALVSQPGPYTVADWERLDHDSNGPRVELINGRFVIGAAPAYLHQGLADELCRLLRDALREHGRGDLRARTGLGVKIAPPHAFVPDVAVVRQQPAGTTSLKAADLVLAVEVVSPRTKRQDRFDKPVAYAAAGVPYFWRIEPNRAAPPVVLAFELVNGQYVERFALHADESATVTASPVPVLIDVNQLYADAL